jgi:hypothetical protein
MLVNRRVNPHADAAEPVMQNAQPPKLLDRVLCPDPDEALQHAGRARLQILKRAQTVVWLRRSGRSPAAGNGRLPKIAVTADSSHPAVEAGLASVALRA